jgi:hypothetical protein
MNPSESLTVSGDAWTICRRHAELRLPKRLTLQQWAARGHILSDDYLFDRAADTWVQARDLAELRLFFRQRIARNVTRAMWVLVLAAMLLFFVAPMFAELLLLAAGVSGMRACRLERSSKQDSRRGLPVQARFM